MAQDYDGKISPKKVKCGDIIHFYDCMENQEEPSETPIIGLVVDIKENNSEVLGYRVLPIIEHPKNEHIKGNEEFFQVTHNRDIDYYMGLNNEHNYRIYYGELTVANNAEHVSAPDASKKQEA